MQYFETPQLYLSGKVFDSEPVLNNCFTVFSEIKQKKYVLYQKA